MKIEDWLPDGTYSLVSKSLYEQKGHLLWAWREPSSRPMDSGWRFLSLHDTTTTLANETAIFVEDQELLKLEPAISQIRTYPVGADFQMARRSGEKYFVYNDTLQPVTPARNVQNLPIEEEIFVDHFEDFAKVYREHQNHAAFSINTRELERLNQALDQMDLLTSVLLGTRDDTLADAELTLITQILIGFNHIAIYEYADVSPRRFENLLPTFMKDRFELSETQVKALLAADTLSADVAHWQAYGHQYFNWLNGGNYQQINQTYNELRQQTVETID